MTDAYPAYPYHSHIFITMHSCLSDIVGRSLLACLLLTSAIPSTGCKSDQKVKSSRKVQSQLDSEKDLARRKAEIIDRMVMDIRGVKSQAVDHPRLAFFSNSIDKTLEGLDVYEQGYNQAGIYIPLDTLTMAEIKAPPKMDYLTFHSIGYWEDLGCAISGYGYLESGKLDTPKNVFLMAK
jgi:hypothetical protein